MVLKKQESLVELVWGENYKEDKIFCDILKRSESNISKEDANYLLDKIIHPEMDFVLKILKPQFEKNCENVSYSTGPILDQHREYSRREKDIRMAYLFSEHSCRFRFINFFNYLIGAANPEYEFVSSKVMGAIHFKRKS